MAITLPIEEVAAAADIMFLLLFAGVNIALIRLRKLRPDLDRGFRVPWVPFTPILAIITMLFLAVFLFFHYPMAWVAAGGWIGVGCLVYYKYSHRREVAFVERTEWMERIERKEYRVLVAVSSPRSVESLMEAALPLARSHQGELVVVSVAEVPEGESLVRERPLTREVEEVLQQAVRLAEERGIKARPVVKIGHRVSHSLVQTAREEACNFLIIGQPKSQSLFERIVATIVERVLEDAPCRVGVVYGTLRRDGIQGIALPVTRGMNSKLAASLAPAYADWFGAKTRPVTIVERETNEEEAQKHAAEAEKTLRDVGLEESLQVLRRRDVGEGLSGAVKRGELVLIGAPSSGPVAPLLGETIPSLMAKRDHTPVMVVRDVEERRARRFERVFFSNNK